MWCEMCHFQATPKPAIGAGECLSFEDSRTFLNLRSSTMNIFNHHIGLDSGHRNL
jgi:hypothetical protein